MRTIFDLGFSAVMGLFGLTVSWQIAAIAFGTTLVLMLAASDFEGD